LNACMMTAQAHSSSTLISHNLLHAQLLHPTTYVQALRALAWCALGAFADSVAITPKGICHAQRHRRLQRAHSVRLLATPPQQPERTQVSSAAHPRT
jgi:hypothetical protein